jgi:hypothetical protein
MNQARMESCTSDRAMNLADVTAEINCTVEFMKFDTELARTMFLGFCMTELRAIASFLFPAKMQMDQNGNYTTNSKLWA